MKKQNKIRIYIFTLCGFFLFLDRLLKWSSINQWNQSKLLHKFFGWQPFLNDGAAFGLPVPNYFTIILTFLIIFFILFVLQKEYTNQYKLFAWCLVLSGALSNLYDRIIHKYVIDYFAFVTGIINIADIMILVGLVLYLLVSWKKEK